MGREVWVLKVGGPRSTVGGLQSTVGGPQSTVGGPRSSVGSPADAKKADASGAGAATQNSEHRTLIFYFITLYLILYTFPT